MIVKSPIETFTNSGAGPASRGGRTAQFVPKLIMMSSEQESGSRAKVGAYMVNFSQHAIIEIAR